MKKLIFFIFLLLIEFSNHAQNQRIEYVYDDVFRLINRGCSDTILIQMNSIGCFNEEGYSVIIYKQNKSFSFNFLHLNFNYKIDTFRNQEIVDVDTTNIGTFELIKSDSIAISLFCKKLEGKRSKVNTDKLYYVRVNNNKKWIYVDKSDNDFFEIFGKYL